MNPYEDNYWNFYKPTMQDAFDAGVRAAKSKTNEPIIPYVSRELSAEYVRGFESIRPWPYRPTHPKEKDHE